MAKVIRHLVVIFVEGDTEVEFFHALIKFYTKTSKREIGHYKIINLKGIGRFEPKVAAKMKHEILPKYPDASFSVCCAYDTDVFEYASKPPTNWTVIGRQLAEINITNFHEIRAVRMIEDWFLIDLNGLCKYLSMTPTPKTVAGLDGFNKMKGLFKKKGKVYLKGNNTHKFIPSLDIKLIRGKIATQLLPLENALGVSL